MVCSPSEGGHRGVDPNTTVVNCWYKVGMRGSDRFIVSTVWYMVSQSKNSGRGSQKRQTSKDHTRHDCDNKTLEGDQWMQQTGGRSDTEGNKYNLIMWCSTGVETQSGNRCTQTKRGQGRLEPDTETRWVKWNRKYKTWIIKGKKTILTNRRVNLNVPGFLSQFASVLRTVKSYCDLLSAWISLAILSWPLTFSTRDLTLNGLFPLDFFFSFVTTHH